MLRFVSVSKQQFRKMPIFCFLQLCVFMVIGLTQQGTRFNHTMHPETTDFYCSSKRIRGSPSLHKPYFSVGCLEPISTFFRKNRRTAQGSPPPVDIRHPALVFKRCAARFRPAHKGRRLPPRMGRGTVLGDRCRFSNAAPPASVLRTKGGVCRHRRGRAYFPAAVPMGCMRQPGSCRCPAVIDGVFPVFRWLRH